MTMILIPYILLIILFLVDSVSSSAIQCRRKYGRAPSATLCDTYTNMGSNQYLTNEDSNVLNTAVNSETKNMTKRRLLEEEDDEDNDPTVNVTADYNPVFDAYCFNEEYPVPNLSYNQQLSFYQDYKNVFDMVKAYTTDVTEEHNNITNDRIPGMFLRMCFHDNAVDHTQPDFQDYVTQSIDPNTNKWIGEAQYLKTSGADASNLICTQERYHPNNNFDSTSSRVLKSIQNSIKKKHKQMSYADLLHNGCNAATIYLTGLDPTTSLSVHPFTFGRKDACHVDQKCHKKYPLCGPSELLPSNAMSVNNVTNWFTNRGMSECLFMGLMWTHTTVYSMGSLCPVSKLPCTTTNDDVKDYTDTSILYFKAGDKLEYFNFFQEPGTHEPLDDEPGCIWNVNGTDIPWPMYQIDCTLGFDNVDKANNTGLKTAMKNLAHNPTQYNTIDILQCALKVLGGKGSAEGGACDKIIPNECNSKTGVNHKFGAYYSTLSSSNKTRITVDPRCERYGFRRRTLEVSNPNDIIKEYTNCLDVSYDMYLVIEGAHFAGLAIPTNYNNTNHLLLDYCPPIVVHVQSEPDEPMEKLMVIASNSDIELIEEETKFHLGSRPLSSIVNAFDAVNVGLNDNTIYNPITNNCVGMLRNMADPLDITLDDTLITFITNRLLLDSADHMFEIIESSPTLSTLYNGANRLLLKNFNKEDILYKMIKYYL